MKRKFKQCLSIPPISTKQTTTSHLKSLNTKKDDIWYGIGNPSPMAIQILMNNNKNLHKFAPLKRPHTIIKLKDNINMDSTRAGSMNACS
jgi:hypothetical protein